MKDIFLAKNGQQQGPYSSEDIQQAISIGQISPSDLAWKEGMPDWVPVSTLIPTTVSAMVHPVASSAPQQPVSGLNANEIRCPGCGNVVYTTQKRCPRCNFKLKDGCFIMGIKIIGGIIALVIALVLALFGLGLIGSK